MANILKRFFWACSGANIAFLDSEKCQTEQSKYVGIGATILFISILAALSFGYAFYIVFDNSETENKGNSLYWATGFGVFWGMIIFNLDRFLVSTLKKDEPSDDKRFVPKLKKGTATFIKSVLPRLFLAVVLALIISKPIELRIFKKEVDAEVSVMQAENAKANTKKILEKTENRDNGENTQNNEANTQNKGQIQQLKDEIEKAGIKISKAKERWTNLQNKRLGELNDSSSVTGRGGTGQNYNAFLGQEEIAKKEYEQLAGTLQKEITDKEEQIRKIEKIISDNDLRLVAETTQKSNQMDGLVTQIQALSRLGQRDSIVWYTNLLIFLIILLLELSPIVNKLIAPYGPYDKLVYEQEQRVFTESDKNSMLLKDELKRLSQSAEERNKALLNIQREIFDDINFDDSNITREEVNNLRLEVVRRVSRDVRTALKNNSRNNNE